MTFRFRNYTQEELCQCKEAFIQHVSNNVCVGTRDWTQFVLDWFANTAASEMYVCGGGCGHGRGPEFMVDLCHLDYPTDPPGPAMWRERMEQVMISRRCSVKLALESEWGRYGDIRTNKCEVLCDAMKLAVLRANVKVMVFASHRTKDDRAELFKALSTLRSVAQDTAPWLCIDVPYDDTPETRNIEIRVLDK